MTHAIVPVTKSETIRRRPCVDRAPFSTHGMDPDAYVTAMWLLFLRTPCQQKPNSDGSWSLGDVGEAPEKSWTKATPYSLARPK